MAEKPLKYSYLLLVFIALTIPSTSNHGLFTLKSLTFLTSIQFFFLHLMFKKKMLKSSLKVFFISSASICFLLFWFFISQFNGSIPGTVAIDQLKLFVLTLYLPLLSLYLINERIITPDQIVCCAIYASMAYIFIKLLTLLLHSLHLVDLPSLVRLFNLRVMSMTIFNGVARIQFSTDIATPYLILFVLFSEKLGQKISGKFKILYLILSLISNLISYSRFLIAVYFISLFLYILSVPLKEKMRGALIACSLLISLVFICGPENFYNGFVDRYTGKSTQISDSIRIEQSRSLLKEYQATPYFGKGLGGYAKDSIRSTTGNFNMHSYEVQWLAFLMQFGIVGILLILSPICLIAFRLIYPQPSLISISFLILFALWIGSGFTNPYLISMQSGAIYTLFAIIPHQIHATKLRFA